MWSGSQTIFSQTPAIFGNYLLSEKANEHVKSVLHGGGGDELFFGYETYRADYYAGLVEWLPNICVTQLEKICHFLPVTNKRIGLKYKAEKFLRGLRLDSLREALFLAFYI